MSRRDQSIKSDIGKPIDKSLSVDQTILININYIGNISYQNQSIFIDFIDFIDSRNTFAGKMYTYFSKVSLEIN